MQVRETYLHHVVFISFNDSASEEMKQEISAKYITLGDDCGGKEAGILFWSVQPNIDLRKGIHLIEIAFFRDHDSYENFKKHPKHVEVVELLKSSANWYVGDIVEIFPRFK